ARAGPRESAGNLRAGEAPGGTRARPEVETPSSRKTCAATSTLRSANTRQHDRNSHGRDRRSRRARPARIRTTTRTRAPKRPGFQGERAPSRRGGRPRATRVGRRAADSPEAIYNFGRIRTTLRRREVRGRRLAARRAALPVALARARRVVRG